MRLQCGSFWDKRRGGIRDSARGHRRKTHGGGESPIESRLLAGSELRYSGLSSGDLEMTKMLLESGVSKDAIQAMEKWIFKSGARVEIARLYFEYGYQPTPSNLREVKYGSPLENLLLEKVYGPAFEWWTGYSSKTQSVTTKKLLLSCYPYGSSFQSFVGRKELKVDPKWEASLVPRGSGSSLG